MKQLRIFSLLFLCAILGWFTSGLIHELFLHQDTQQTRGAGATVPRDTAVVTNDSLP
jgi:hypothetical protein